MKHFDPTENDRRLRKGLTAIVARKTIEFAKENANLIVVFDDPFTKYSFGRVIQFQDYIYEITGCVPEIIKGVPCCIKIFFSLDVSENDKINSVFSALKSADATEVYRSLGISQVQYKGQIIIPNL